MGGGPLFFIGYADNFTPGPETAHYAGWGGKIGIIGSLGGDTQMNLEGFFPAGSEQTPATDLDPDTEPPIRPLVVQKIDEHLTMVGTLTDPNCLVTGQVPVHLTISFDWEAMMAEINVWSESGRHWAGCCSDVCGDLTSMFSFPLELELAVPIECAKPTE